MKLKLTLTFNDLERRALLEFQRVINQPGQDVLSLEHICRQAIFLSIQESYRRALNSGQMEKSNGKSSEGDTQGDTQSASVSENAPAGALADSQSSAVESSTGG